MANITVNTTELMELLEVTPEHLRIRKQILDNSLRMKAKFKK